MNLYQKTLQKYREMPKQVKASVWFVICGFIQRGITFLTTPIFSRLLTTSEYGIYSVYNTWHNIIIIFASLNLASGVYLRGLIKYEEDREEFTASLQSLYLLNFLIVFAVYVCFSGFWSNLLDLPPKYLYLMFLDILVQVAFHFWSARQRVSYEYKFLVAATLINAVLRPTIGVIAVLHSDNRVDARIMTMVLADVLVFGWFFADFFIRKQKVFSTKYWKYALAYNLPLVPHYLSQLVLNQSDRVMIKSLVGSSEAGIYSLAYTAAAILTIVNQSIQNSYNPWMFKSIRDRHYDRIGKVSYMTLLIVAGLNLFLIICAPEVIRFMAPKSYHEAIWVIPPVACSTFFMYLYGLFSNVEFYYEKTRFVMAASVFGAALNIGLNYVFIRMFGYIAAGYTTLFCYFVYCVMHYIMMRRILKKELPDTRLYDMKIIFLIAGSFVGVSAVCMALYNHSVIRYAVIGCMLAAAAVKRKAIRDLIKGLKGLKSAK